MPFTVKIYAELAEWLEYEARDLDIDPAILIVEAIACYRSRLVPR